MGLESVLNIFNAMLIQNVTLESWDIANENLIISNENAWNTISKWVKKDWNSFTKWLKDMWNKIIKKKEELKEITEEVAKKEKELINTSSAVTTKGTNNVISNTKNNFTKDDFIKLFKGKDVYNKNLDPGEKLKYGANKTINDLDELELADLISNRLNRKILKFREDNRDKLVGDQETLLWSIYLKIDKTRDLCNDILKVRNNLLINMRCWNDNVRKKIKTEQDAINLWKDRKKFKELIDDMHLTKTGGPITDIGHKYDDLYEELASHTLNINDEIAKLVNLSK